MSHVIMVFHECAITRIVTIRFKNKRFSFDAVFYYQILKTSKGYSNI